MSLLKSLFTQGTLPVATLANTVDCGFAPTFSRANLAPYFPLIFLLSRDVKMVSELPLPPSDAPPSVVRAYFSEILSKHHDVPSAEAIAITAQWRVGRGSELTYYDIETFRAIFGAEIGTLLFGYARKELKTSRAPSAGLGKGVKKSEEGAKATERDIFGLTPGCKSTVSNLTGVIKKLA